MRKPANISQDQWNKVAGKVINRWIASLSHEERGMMEAWAKDLYSKAPPTTKKAIMSAGKTSSIDGLGHLGQSGLGWAQALTGALSIGAGLISQGQTSKDQRRIAEAQARTSKEIANKQLELQKELAEAANEISLKAGEASNKTALEMAKIDAQTKLLAQQGGFWSKNGKMVIIAGGSVLGLLALGLLTRSKYKARRAATP